MIIATHYCDGRVAFSVRKPEKQVEPKVEPKNLIGLEPEDINVNGNAAHQAKIDQPMEKGGHGRKKAGGENHRKP